MPEYDVPKLPTFTDNPKGLFVIRIANLTIDWPENAKLYSQRFFFILKTPRMVFKTKSVRGDESIQVRYYY